MGEHRENVEEKDMLIYWISGSIPCWRVFIVLEEKGVGDRCVKKRLDFAKEEHKSEEVKKINPRGQVPAFRNGDLIINESMAICDYLERKFKERGPQLMPEDERQRAHVQQRLHEAYYNLQKTFVENIIYYKWLTKPEKIDEDLLAARNKAARAEIEVWNGYLRESGQDYITGDKFNMADIVFYTFLSLFVHMGLKLDPDSDLMAYFERLSERPSIKSTWPPHWPSDTGPARSFFSDV